jgi:hypothetical protein
MAFSCSSDPLLYSLKNVVTTQHQLEEFISTSNNKRLVEKHHQFSDTSCQERSIMIDKLIDTSADIIDSIWKQPINSTIMTTCQFIREILKRSRATYSMLQLALFYIFRIKKIIQQHLVNKQNVIGCGRRMFLAALMCASKYLNDKNYRNKTWAKIASLPVQQVNKTEAVFLQLVDYQLYVGKALYDKWVALLHEHIQKKQLIQHHHPLYTTAIADHYYHYQHHQPVQQDQPSPLQHTPLLSPNKGGDSPLSDISQTPPLAYPLKRKSSFIDDKMNNNKHIRLA